MAKTEKQKEWYNNWRKTPEGKAKRREYVAKWKSNNPEQSKLMSRKSYIKNKYGISLDEWDSMFNAQGRVCAICASPDSRARNWHTDHNHTTNQVRGILCNWCNTAIGKLQESSDIMEKAIQYLRKYG